MPLPRASVTRSAPDAVADALAQTGSLDGKVVVDATNNLSGGPGGLEIAALVPGARYVKAFNTVFSTFMHDTPPSSPATLVYCGDDADAKATVADLIADLGFEPVDAGGADATPLVEAFAQARHRARVRTGARPLRLPLPAELTRRPSALDSAA